MFFNRPVSTKTSTLVLIAASSVCLYLSALLYLTSQTVDNAEVLSANAGGSALSGLSAGLGGGLNKVTDNKTQKMITLNTSKGKIEIELFASESPKTVENFTKLAESGFYNGTKFHRVIRGFMIQGGDPLSKDDSKMDFWGTGGPGYKFKDEINPNDDLYKTGYVRGVVAMANAGPDTNGSQFFIMHSDNNLPPLYTIFGRVVSGIETVDKIAEVNTNEKDRPLEAVVLESVEVK